MTNTEELLTIPQIVQAARANLRPEVWDWLCGGSGSETTLRRNRSAFDYLAFRPRVLRGGIERDISATFLGHRLSLPVMLAPFGPTSQLIPNAGLAAARAAERAGTATFISTAAEPSLAEIRANASGPLVFQIYVFGDRSWVKQAVNLAEQAEFDAICLTIDVPRLPRRERELVNKYSRLDGALWPNRLPDPEGGALAGQQWQEALTWDDVEWLKSTTRLPLVLKGILSGEDAQLAIEHGVDVVHVSNHGGRQLDHAPATIEVLPEIVEAVAGRAEVIVDSGFMRGTDVLKALALGARAVLIGKLQAMGLAAGGEAGLDRVLDILRKEIEVTMANLGVRSLSELGPAMLRPARPPDSAPWPIGPADQSM